MRSLPTNINNTFVRLNSQTRMLINKQRDIHNDHILQALKRTHNLIWLRRLIPISPSHKLIRPISCIYKVSE